MIQWQTEPVLRFTAAELRQRRESSARLVAAWAGCPCGSMGGPGNVERWRRVWFAVNTGAALSSKHGRVAL